MLDIEIVTEPSVTGVDVVTRAEMKRHLRISSTVTALDDEIDQVIYDAVDKLGGLGGELNRTILVTQYRRYMNEFPGLDSAGVSKPIMVPFPPLVSVDAITIEDGSSPDNNIDSADYIVRSGMLIPEIHPVDVWPTVTAAPRAVSVTYTAGYESGSYPPKLRRMVKILAAHYHENIEATIREQSKTEIPRKVLFAMDDLRAALRIPPDYGDWGE